MILFVKLLLAHCIGDFILQPTSWVNHKEKHTWKSGYLYAHIVLHFVLVMLVMWKLSYWYWALVIAGTHGIIDLLKLQFQRKKTKRAWFFADQAAHLTILVGVVYVIKDSMPVADFWKQSYWYVVAGAVLLTTPTAMVIKLLMLNWSKKTGDDDSDSLRDAGLYIGILERLFVFVFILIDQFSAIGFLLAAKSIFRFGDLTRAKDRKLTEYILIGTLLSFGLAIITGLLVKKCM